jgi:uncharacterized FlgJ-related protein
MADMVVVASRNRKFSHSSDQAKCAEVDNDKKNEADARSSVPDSVSAFIVLLALLIVFAIELFFAM